MTQSVCILGRQPALGMAELESLFGAKALQPIGQLGALLDVEPGDVDFSRLGGSLKLCKLLTYLPGTELPAIIKYISDTLPKHFDYIPAGKIHLGLSFYGFGFNAGKINAAALSLKKNLKSSQRGMRMVPNKQPELNAAQVIHNQLTGRNGMELVLIKWGKRTVLAQTVDIQDIDAYAARDQARPKRDARVGMLPPKLAQIIINLAVNGSSSFGSRDSSQTANSEQRAAILDPFCGTGVVLQEALLMGFDAYGTDIEERMIDYSRENLDWLATKHMLDKRTYLLEAGDATSFDWQDFDAIACETYLGRPFSAMPSPDVIDEVMRDVDLIHKKFLKNVARQTKPGLRMCLAVPAWKTKSGFKHLKTLDSLEEMGYTRQGFVHASNDNLVYHRENQIVARELVTLIRK